MKGQVPQRGFTLIELLFVVAIISLLAALAMPIYQDFISRTQATRVMRETAHLKNLIEQCVAEGARQVGRSAGECDLGDYNSNLVSSFNASLESYPIDLSIVFGGRAMGSLTGHSLIWRRQANGVWECLSDIAAQLLPRGCNSLE